MVKRKGHFMEKLCTIDNINLADDNARMNKVKSKKWSATPSIGMPTRAN